MDSESDSFMYTNGKAIKHTRHISRGVHFVRNGENFKMHKIDWCEEGLQLADIETNNIGVNDLNTGMKYIIARLYNWDRTLLQQGWTDTG